MLWLYGFVCSPYSDHERLRHLEEEQEQLNSSLLALTTHFAQVQFRLKQIVSAETSDREVSFRGFDFHSLMTLLRLDNTSEYT